MKPILLATDGSPTAELATKKAIVLADALDAPIVVATIWEISYEPVGLGFTASLPDLTTFRRDEAVGVAERAAAEIRDAGLEVETVVRKGIAAHEICAIADSFDAQLIVIGSHGWGAFKRLLFGSVSTAVLHHAIQPVLVVPKTADVDAEAALHRETAEV